MMSVAIFSSKDEDCIERKVQVRNNERTPPSEVDSVYGIEGCVQWIAAGQYKRIALQFPNELMGDAVLVSEKIEALIEGKVFILGDTAYGSCCVDEVSAEHCVADCILHYGHACLSPTRRLPVLYVFGHSPFQTSHCVEGFRELFPNKDEKVIVMYDTVYYYAIEELKQLLESECTNLVVSELLLPDTRQDSSCQTEDSHSGESSIQTICKCGRRLKLSFGADVDSYSIFYVGDEGPTLTNMIMTFNKSKFYSYNPATKTSRKESLNVNRALMKRFYLIEKAKDAQIVGIVVGTLGVSNFADIINQLKKVIHLAGKKSYTFVVGKLNVAKLANFMEIDIFVYVACPENTLLDSSDFYKPVITPFEMEMACNKARTWAGEIYTDFTQLLPGAASYVEMCDDDCEESDVSLITGKLRHIGRASADDKAGAVVKRSELWTMAPQSKSAAEFLSDRSWKGLEQGVGETPVSLAIEGARGIAISYAGEGERNVALKGSPKIAIEYEVEKEENG